MNLFRLTDKNDFQTKKARTVLHSRNSRDCAREMGSAQDKGLFTGSFLEEAIGDSTNLYIMYPGLVYGFLHLLRASGDGEGLVAPNDVALTASGEPVAAIRRYHDVLLGLAGRRLVRDDYTRYEAVCLAMVVPRGETRNQLLAAFPQSNSPLHFTRFFETLYSA